MRHGLACLLFVCAIAAGCGDPDGPDPDFPIGLDRVRDLSVSIHALLPEDGPATLRVTVWGDAICIAAGSEFAVTLPGAETLEWDRGRNDEDFCGGRLFAPHVVLAVDRDALTTPAIVTVSDQYESVRLDLGDLLVPRVATLVAPADGVLHSGQPIDVRWSPALAIADVTALGHVAGDDETHTLAPAAAGDSRLTATAPAFVRDADDATVEVSLGGDRAIPCDGARCSARATWSATFPIALRRD
jgi:hypothetical protein